MTADEFRALLAEQSDLQLLETCLHFDSTPFAFEPKPETWDLFRDELVDGLGIQRADIRVVGSSRLGISMKPGQELRSFRDTSDIDVAVVNAELFDRLWLALLRAAYPRLPIVTKLGVGGWLKNRRNEVYTGWLTPHDVHLDITVFGTQVRPVLEFKAQWFDSLKRAARYPPRRHEDVSGRLYRTWEHAELYHLDSLSSLRRSLTN
jgi:hypothetical protein